MYRYFLSKKGYTFFEMLIVLVILAILTAVAVPVFSFVARKQRIKDCRNQIETVKGYVSMVMSGMQDNGVKIVNMTVTGAAVHGSGTSKYWVVSTSETPTVGQMRFGQTQKELSASQSATDHLKKSSMSTIPFKNLLLEVPGCPLSVDKHGDETKTYGYRIYSDGRVTCDNPNCPNCPDFTG